LNKNEAVKLFSPLYTDKQLFKESIKQACFAETVIFWFT
jgi:hypothetical protein